MSTYVLKPELIKQIEELMQLVSKYQIAALTVGEISISKHIHVFDNPPQQPQEPGKEVDEDLISWSAS